MPGTLTEITELATALGMVSASLHQALYEKPPQLVHLPAESWENLKTEWITGSNRASFQTAFANGQAFLRAQDGLRGRPPIRVEWKGPHRPPGDDVIPADLRVDHVYLISCKYLSKVLLNSSPRRLFEDRLVGETRNSPNWFLQTAPEEYQAFYESAIGACNLSGMCSSVAELTKSGGLALKEALKGPLPPTMVEPWRSVCTAVSEETAKRWNETLGPRRSQLRLLWRLLRVSGAAYFVLGADRTSHLRLRVDSTWDWLQRYELRQFTVAARRAGQPEVGWQAIVKERTGHRAERVVEGHVEIRWSHGRFHGVPEAKVYLDTPHSEVPGYNRLC